MKIKYHILLVLFLTYVNVAFAWQSGYTKEQFSGKEEGKTEFNPHWFLSLQGGGAYTLGEAIFGDLVSPSVAVALGYKFTPLFAVRAEASGWQAKGGWVNPAITYKYKYLQGGLDAMFDLSNLCYGFHSKRIFNAYLFLGIGLNGAFDNDEAVALNASGYNLQRLWTGKKLYASGRIGLGTNLRLNDHVAINFELNTNMLSDKFNSKKGVNADWQFNGLVGLSFTLGKSSRKVAPVSYEPEQPVSVTTVEQRPEPIPVVENEIELIEGCRAGKDSARKELYTLYSKQMLAVCYRYTGDVDAAHDVLHDGFIKIFTHFTFRGECALSTWVTRVMVTQAIDYLRKQQRFSQLVVNEEQLPDIPDEAGIAETGGRISEEMLMAFVAELPDGCRTVFNLYVFEEKSHKEIAEILHIKEHSSTSQLHRAKCLLIKRIKEYTEYERK